MAKTPSDKLYRLVKSLSPTEKRYFKIFVGTKIEGDKKYSQLFDLIDSAAVFDDEFFKSKIYKSQISESKKYPELKAYLYDLILKCLQSFDEKQSVEARLNHFLQSVSALFKRGLYDDCLELLAKAAKIAKQYEQFSHQIDIIRWEKQLAYTRMDVDFLHKELERLNDEETRALERLQNEAQFRQSFFQVYTTIKKEAVHRNDDRTARLRSLTGLGGFEPPKDGQPIFVDADSALSHRARVTYYRTLNLYYYASQDQENFYESGKKLIQLIESQPHFLKENLSDYIASLSNLILSCGLLHHYDEVRDCLEKLKNLPPQTEDDRRKIHRQYFTGKLVLCIFTGEFDEGRVEMQQHLVESIKIDPHEIKTASFYFQYFCICFGCGDFDAALDYLNQWLNQPRSVEREDLQSLARILSIIIHFEMGNVVLLESLLRSTTRYLQSKHRFFELEKRFLHYISELLRTTSPQQKRLIFSNFYKEIEPISSHPEVQNTLQTFDLLAWVESKISGKTFAQTVRERLTVDGARQTIGA